MVVEDNDLNRKLFCDVLRANGFEVEAVADGNMVLQTARDIAPDLIIMDIQLGGVSVGAQQQGQGQPGQPGEPGSQAGTRGARTPAASDAAAASSVQAPVQPRPRSDGSQPLDMFV